MPFRSPCQRTIHLALLLASALGGCCAQADDLGPLSAQEYGAQIETTDGSKAILAAEELIAAARLDSKEKPVELAEALTLLGNAQFAMRNYISAEAAYFEALQILEPRVTPMSGKLLEPLRGMGYTLAYAGEHDRAVPYMKRALLVLRRTHGLFDIDQRDLLRHLAVSLTRIDMHVEAEKQMQYLVRAGQQTYGARDARMAGVYGQLGDFYMQTGLTVQAREAYRDALEAVEQQLGRNHLATVRPLRAYAASYRRELQLVLYGLRGRRDEQVGYMRVDSRSSNPRYLNADGKRALKRAIETLDTNPARPTSLLLDTLLDLGDWYMIRGAVREALPHYRRAASLLEQVEPEYRRVAHAKLGFPAQVYYPVPPAATRHLNRSGLDMEEHFVYVQFTVAADGSVRDEQVIEASAPEPLVRQTIYAIRAARYRPKFMNGEPVQTQAVGLRQIFKSRRDPQTE
jgi:tetratricopeptide (TPR) repeat protein